MEFTFSCRVKNTFHDLCGVIIGCSICGNYFFSSLFRNFRMESVKSSAMMDAAIESSHLAGSFSFMQKRKYLDRYQERQRDGICFNCVFGDFVMFFVGSV